MLIINVKEEGSIEKAIKKYRRKHKKTKTLQQIRNKKHYKKPSKIKREQLKKAQYKEQFLINQENK